MPVGYPKALTTLVVAIVACGLAVPARIAAQESDLERGRALARLLIERDVQALDPMLSPALRAALAAQGGLAAFAERVAAAGPETSVESEDVYHFAGTTYYYRIVRMAGFPAGTIMTVFGWDREDVVTQMLVAPAPTPAPSDHIGYQTRTRLRVPFDGEWTVFWGGRTYPQNRHVVAPDQRFAYDFAVVRDGSTHRGEGGANEDYYCWGSPVLAPASGTVTEATGNLPDQEPGKMDPRNPAGNHVVIDHGQGEHSVLAHLRSGSVTVSVGDRVEPGQIVGSCGNSGNTSEPHLHYHLQTAPRFGEGVGLPAQFLDYVADGHSVARGEPERGQRIRPGGR